MLHLKATMSREYNMLKLRSLLCKCNVKVRFEDIDALMDIYDLLNLLVLLIYLIL